MKRSAHLAITAPLLVCCIVGWATHFCYRAQNPAETKLYGTFGTSTHLDSAIFVTFEEEKFTLYKTDGGEMIDEGTWTQTEDNAVLNGENSTYSLLVKGRSIYLSGGNFTRMVELIKMEETPIFVSVNK